MALVTTKQMLLNAQAEGYAVGAFNVENMEMVQAVVAAAEELHAPVILQTTPSTIRYADLSYYYAAAKVAAEKASVPVAVHLDHGSSFELAMKALRQKFGINENMTHVEKGLPEEVIPDLAEHLQAGIVVLGTVGRTGISAAFLGNTAEQVIDHLRCDLLVIKPDQYQTPVELDDEEDD